DERTTGRAFVVLSGKRVPAGDDDLGDPAQRRLLLLLPEDGLRDARRDPGGPGPERDPRSGDSVPVHRTLRPPPGHRGNVDAPIPDVRVSADDLSGVHRVDDPLLCHGAQPGRALPSRARTVTGHGRAGEDASIRRRRSQEAANDKPTTTATSASVIHRAVATS